MIRDNYQCQYCSKKLGKGNKSTSTIDHVIPRTQGGPTNYTNCVACCKDCNSYKRDRTPEEAGMKLLTVPRKPSFLVLYKHYLTTTSPEEWSNYIIGYSHED